MASHWQSYRGGPTKRASDVVHISINRRNTITLNRRAMKLLGGAEAVLLVFDEQNSIIGLIESNLRNDEAFPLRCKEGRAWEIYASPFCRHFNISVDYTERFIDPEMDSDGILRLNLKRTHNVSLRRRTAIGAVLNRR